MKNVGHGEQGSRLVCRDCCPFRLNSGSDGDLRRRALRANLCAPTHLGGRIYAGHPNWIIIESARQVLDDPDNPSDLEVLIDGARRKFDKPDPGTEQLEAGPLNVVGLSSFVRMKLPERKTMFSPWLPEQGLVMVYAERGIGKTYFALNVAHAVATGGSYLNRQRPYGELYGRLPVARDDLVRPDNRLQFYIRPICAGLLPAGPDGTCRPAPHSSVPINSASDE